MFIMLGAVLLVAAALAFVKITQFRKGMAMMQAMQPPPAAVTTVVVQQEVWQPTARAVGSLKAVNGVAVSTDLPGIVAEIAFQSGAEVNKGDLLLKLDSQQEQAQLRSAEARRDLAKQNLDRQKELVASGAVSQSNLDSADSLYRQAVAAVDEARVLIARKNITAPFAGRLGIRQVDLGQYLNVGAPIVQLESIDPIHVEFAVPQQNLAQVSVGKKLRLKAAGLNGEEFTGEVTAVESRLDAATRNVMIQGTAANNAGKLRPGMFVEVEVFLPEQEVVTVPASAISYAPYGDSVFVVKDGKTVEQQFVKLGAMRGDKITVLTGLKAGDEVVSSGVFKLRNGVPVQVNNSVQPGNNTNPNPPNT
ncbi:MAG: Multidrug resistance protein MdtA [Verrucomicrobiae bacterium]|nr:Multidrug resistance protein MdtA [Verrucomicrobiae bacterium]